MIHNKNNELAECRNRANIRVQDLAFVLNLSPVTLVQMESGKQTPSPSVIATYHVLFGTPMEEPDADLCAEMHCFLYERSTKLIEELERSQSPKSNQRVQAFSRIVKLLTTDQYYEHN